MSNIDEIPKVLKRLAKIEWRWMKSEIQTIATQLGISHPERESNWIYFRSPAPDAQTGFCFRGEEVLQFTVLVIAMFDIGEFVDEHNFYDILKKHDARFRRQFLKVSKLICDIFGKPAFEGGPDDKGIEEQQPDIIGITLVGVWPLNNGRLILRYDHSDKECPLVLDLIVVPTIAEK